MIENIFLLLPVLIITIAASIEDLLTTDITWVYPVISTISLSLFSILILQQFFFIIPMILFVILGFIFFKINYWGLGDVVIFTMLGIVISSLIQMQIYLVVFLIIAAVYSGIYITILRKKRTDKNLHIFMKTIQKEKLRDTDIIVEPSDKLDKKTKIVSMSKRDYINIMKDDKIKNVTIFQGIRFVPVFGISLCIWLLILILFQFY